MTDTRGARRKDGRLELRIDAAQRQLLANAAAAQSMTVSSFVLTHAAEAARDVLADRTQFTLPDERWTQFRTLLDRDPRAVPDLTAFLARPSVLDSE